MNRAGSRCGKFRNIIVRTIHRGADVRHPLVWIAAAAAAAVYFLLDPETTAFMPKCPVKFFLGLSCPGCGSQRALHALLHGDVARALHFNFLMVAFLLPYGAALLAENLLPKASKARRAMHRILENRYMVALAIVLAATWVVVRNILHI